jgi:hypothetical protein
MGILSYADKPAVAHGAQRQVYGMRGGKSHFVNIPADFR